MLRKSALILCLLASIGLVTALNGAAFSQTPNQPKLNIGNIVLNPVQQGYYDADVNLNVRQSNNRQINFAVLIQHVKTLDEVYDRLKPAIDQLADELKNAQFDRPNFLAQPNVLKDSNILK